MTPSQPGPFRLLAIIGAVALAAGCTAAPPVPSSHHPVASATEPSATSTGWPDGPGDSPAFRLVVATGLPASPQLAEHDLGKGAGGTPIVLPAGLDGLAALAGAPDGTLALVGPTGATWLASSVRTDDAAHDPGWRALAPVAPPVGGGRAGPVLGAAWVPDGAGLVVTAGTPGAAVRRTEITSRARDGSGGRVLAIPHEADGPGLGALADRQVVLVLRDHLDRGTLARVTDAGTVTFLGSSARGVATGGDLVAVVAEGGVLVGAAAALGEGALPGDLLPLTGELGIGSVAVAPDGRAVAVVRLDDDGNAVRVDVLARRADTWALAAAVLVARRPGGVAVGWWRHP